MTAKQAIKKLMEAGYEFVKFGKGPHIILQKGTHKILLTNGRGDLSYGMQGKVRTALNKKGLK